MKYGSQTLDSYARNSLVGTEKTSAGYVSGYHGAETVVQSLTIDFLQRELFGFSHETEYHAPGDEVQSCIESDWRLSVIRPRLYHMSAELTRSNGSHSIGHGWVGQRQDTSKCVVDADSPSHTLLTLDGRENLSRVLESDWSFSQGICDCKKVDETVRALDPTIVKIINNKEQNTHSTTGPI